MLDWRKNTFCRLYSDLFKYVFVETALYHSRMQYLGAGGRGEWRGFLQSWHDHVIFLFQCLLLPFFSSNPLFGWLDLLSLPTLGPNSFISPFCCVHSHLCSTFRNGEEPNDNWESKLKNSSTQWL